MVCLEISQCERCIIIQVAQCLLIPLFAFYHVCEPKISFLIYPFFFLHAFRFTIVEVSLHFTLHSFISFISNQKIGFGENLHHLFLHSGTLCS
jgi:hypothetical protein